MNLDKQREKSKFSPSHRAYKSANNRSVSGTSCTKNKSSVVKINDLNFNCTVNLNEIMIRNFNKVSKKNKKETLDNIMDKFNCRVLLTDIKSHTFFNRLNSNTLKMMQNACGNGELIHAKRCGSIKCLFQHKFFPKNKSSLFIALTVD